MKKVIYLLILILFLFVNINVYAETTINFCNQDTVKAFIFMGKIVQIVKIFIPLIIIIMGMIDFGRAVISDDERAISKCVVSLIRRLIAGIVVFFIPTVVYGILGVIEADELNNYTSKFTCGKCVLKVNSCDSGFISGLPKQ